MFVWLAQGGVRGQCGRAAFDQRTAEPMQVALVSGAIDSAVPYFHLGSGEHLKPLSEVW